MSYSNYLFDLDGTLTDPGVGIKNSIRYALEKRGYSPLREDELNAFIGPPLLDTFQKYCHVSREESAELVTTYREYFSTRGMFENTVYEGIPEALAALRERGAKLYVATSKPEPFAVRILEHFDLAKYFEFIGGSTMDETRTDKAEVIAYVLETAGLRPEESVMIGDRRYDVRGGKTCGLATVGVLFGYGDREELSEADLLVEKPRALGELPEAFYKKCDSFS